jgi:ABC-2 type transport system ATP-binding protein
MSGVEAAIEARGLTRRFGAFTAVDAVSFTVHRGEIFGYLGANGAGKSTTIRMLCALLAPSDGNAVVNGFDVIQNPEAVKQSIGYMSQRFSLYPDLTVWENVRFFGGAYGLHGKRLRRNAERVLELAGLQSRKEMLTAELPGGWRQRLALATAMLHEPSLIFLDEPTSGVDPLARRRFWRLIRELAESGTTIFVTTHYMDEAEYCDRIGLMVDGRLVALDTPAALKRRAVPGPVFRVESRDLHRARALLEQTPGILRVAAFGARLHVIALPDAPWDASRLEQALRDGGLRDAAVEPAEATLEDVFIELAAPGGRRG